MWPATVTMEVVLRSCQSAELSNSVFVCVEILKNKWLKMVIERNGIHISNSKYQPNNEYELWLANICDCAKQFSNINTLCNIASKCTVRRKYWRVNMKCQVFLVFVNNLRNCSSFRSKVIETIILNHKLISTGLHYSCNSQERIHFNLKIVLDNDLPFVIDKTWSGRIDNLIQAKIELEDVMAWLSTLGGAYSQLADSEGRDFKRHALTAGNISKHQFRIALLIGDPTIIARCKLYLALSMMQLGRIRRPKQIIREQYQLAKSLAENCRDIRLENMCTGLWTKLQHQVATKRATRPNTC